MSDAVKLLIVGLDGLNFDLLARLLPKEVMPAVWKIVEQGVSGDLASVFPTHSAAAWASFMTGQEPAKHGVFDFKVRLPDGHYRHAKPDPQATLWHWLGLAGYRVGIFNFPITYPPDPVNGWMVSGMLSPDLQHFTFPAGLAAELTAVFPDYVLDVEWKLYDGREEELLRDLTHMVQQRGAVAQFLLEHHPVDVLAMAFIATDRAQHALWRYLDPQHPFHDPEAARALRPSLHAFYSVLDREVARLLERVGPETRVLLLSDHGFQAAAWQFHVDEWLQSQGWLVRRAAANQFARWVRRFDTARVRQLRQRIWPDMSRHFTAFSPGGTIDWGRTQAFCPWNFHQGIRLNLRGRDPAGIVSPGGEFERLRAEIGSRLESLRFPVGGEKVVSRVYAVDALDEGAHAPQMPDLVFDLNSNFAPGIHHAGLFEPTGWLSGDHSQQGFYALCGSELPRGSVQPARLIDIAPTVLHMLGLPCPASMDGISLVGLAPGLVVQHQAITPLLDVQGGAPPASLTPEEEQKMLQQLRDLGYL